MTAITFPVQDDGSQGFETGKVTIPDGTYDVAPTQNNGWSEEQIGPNLYRWTQCYTITTSATWTTHTQYYLSSQQNFPAPPNGANFFGVEALVTQPSSPGNFVCWVAQGQWPNFFILCTSNPSTAIAFQVCAVGIGTKA